MDLLKVLTVFALGSLTGLVSLSHFLGYLLKHYKKATFAVIIGFITGSLGVVWPWKDKVLEYDTAGNVLLDTNGQEIIVSYKRFFPSELSFEALLVIIFIIVGIFFVVSLELYQKKNKLKHG